MDTEIVRARSAGEIAAARALVWEFFDFLRGRYPEMQAELDAYIAHQDVAGGLENFGDYFLPPNGECFLARHKGDFVGLVMLKPRGGGDGEMNRMFVRESARGLGLGRKLAEALVGEARALGLGTLWLNAIYRHHEALALYESLGFRRYEGAEGYAADDARSINMKLSLGGT